MPTGFWRFMRKRAKNLTFGQNSGEFSVLAKGMPKNPLKFQWVFNWKVLA